MGVLFSLGKLYQFNILRGGTSSLTAVFPPYGRGFSRKLSPDISGFSRGGLLPWRRSRAAGAILSVRLRPARSTAGNELTDVARLSSSAEKTQGVRDSSPCAIVVQRH